MKCKLVAGLVALVLHNAGPNYPKLMNIEPFFSPNIGISCCTKLGWLFNA